MTVVTHPTSIRLRPALKDALRKEASRRRWTVAQTIVLALEEWISENKRKRR